MADGEVLQFQAMPKPPDFATLMGPELVVFLQLLGENKRTLVLIAELYGMRNGMRKAKLRLARLRAEVLSDEPELLSKLESKLQSMVFAEEDKEKTVTDPAKTYPLTNAIHDLVGIIERLEVEAWRSGQALPRLLGDAVLAAISLAERGDTRGLTAICKKGTPTLSRFKDARFGDELAVNLRALWEGISRVRADYSPQERAQSQRAAVGIFVVATLHIRAPDYPWIPRGSLERMLLQVEKAFGAHLDDHGNPSTEDDWRDISIKMLRAVGVPPKKARNVMWANVENAAKFKAGRATH